MKANKNGGVLRAVKKPRGGVKVHHNKNTAGMEVVRMPAPSRVYLPMQQHIGAPCTPTVKVGDIVSVGQVIGDSDKFVSAPIHATVSGKVAKIDEIRLPTGAKTQCVILESDGEMRTYEGIHPPKIETRADIVKAMRDSGMVGMGGAGFPTHVKFAYDESKKIDTLIINAAECEPFITVDHRECLDRSKDIMSGVYTLLEYFGFEQVIIAVEDNKQDVFKVLQDIADDERDKENRVRLMSLKSVYPQGAEKMMVQSATGRRVPPGKLPADVGCVVMNVTTVAFLGRYLRTGRPLVSRSLTIDGSAIAHPQNVRVPIGTPINEIIEFCGGYKCDPAKLIMGGPMMGISLSDDTLPILKQNNAVLAFDAATVKNKPERACIRCGRCAQVCPMSLMPTLIERYARVKDVDRLNNIGVNVCMECGSCSFSCPSGRPLVQYMRLAKTVVREAGAKK